MYRDAANRTHPFAEIPARAESVGAVGHRIVVVGPARSRKSTLARELGLKLALTVVELDALFWKPGWQPASDDEFLAYVSSRVSGDRWVVD